MPDNNESDAIDRKPERPQFRIRTLLLCMLGISVLMAWWLAPRDNWVGQWFRKVERDAVEEFEKEMSRLRQVFGE